MNRQTSSVQKHGLSTLRLLGIFIFTISLAVSLFRPSKSSASSLESNIALNDLDSLVLHLTFDDDTANDSSIYGNDGMVNGATFIDSPIAGGGRAVSFDGSGGLNTYVRVSPSPIPTGANTISFWVYAKELPTDATYYSRIMLLGDTDAWRCQNQWEGTFFAFFNLPTDITFTRYEEPDSTPETLIRHNWNLGTHSWHHIVGTWDGTTSTNGVKLYVDGDLVGQATSSIAYINSINDLVLGHMVCNLTDTTYAFNGYLDELKVYNEELSASEIQALYISENPITVDVPVCGTGHTEGMIAYWQAENDARDSYDNHNGVLNGGTNFVSGKVGQGFNFDGIDDSIDIPDSPDLNPVNEITLEAWVNFRSIQTDWLPRYNMIFDKRGDVDNPCCFESTTGFFLAYNGWVKAWTVRLPIEDSLPYAGYGIYETLTLNSWYHIVVTYDGSYVRFYRNGEMLLSSPHRGLLRINDKPVGISQPHYYLDSHSDVIIDEAAIYNSALTVSEINQHFANGEVGVHYCIENSLPLLSINDNDVSVDEGYVATNTGTIIDPEEDAVSLSTNLGSVTNNGDGTWFWNFLTSDGPAQGQIVIITADDGNGGTSQISFDLIVNNEAPSVTNVFVPVDPLNINYQAINVSVGFSDPAGSADEPYICTIDYGDGNGPQMGNVSGTSCIGSGHVYEVPGVYAVTATVTDKDGASGSATASNFIVVYDPAGGFVTGGGWIWSPSGACIANPTLEGKATFGFVSKYLKGAKVPTGNTEFQFKTGDLNFKSTSYQWLIINQDGSNAQFKGYGMINGMGNYGFMIWAADGSPDTFRIKIWDASNEMDVIYDNGVSQPIGGGSIVIHTK